MPVSAVEVEPKTVPCHVVGLLSAFKTKIFSRRCYRNEEAINVHVPMGIVGPPRPTVLTTYCNETRLGGNDTWRTSPSM